MDERCVRPAPSRARDWLAVRLDGTPPELAAAVRGLLAASGREPTAERMVEAAIDTFERVPAASQERAIAIDLLAADALLTYAFEAAADCTLGGSFEQVMRLARAAGPVGELGRRCVG